MSGYREKQCPQCGQQLRVPADIGGMLMACPSCGEKFHSDFKLSGAQIRPRQGLVSRVFGMPYRILMRLRRFLSAL